MSNPRGNPCTLNSTCDSRLASTKTKRYRRVREYGSQLKQFLPERVSDTEADAVIPDGTKCHSQDDDRTYHSVQATLGEDTADNSRSLLDLSVNADWDETASELDDMDAVTDDAAVVSDGDDGIVTAFTDQNREHQLDLVHVGRTLEYNLRLVKYADPDHDQAFLDELLQRSTKTTMRCDISIESTRGKL